MEKQRETKVRVVRVVRVEAYGWLRIQQRTVSNRNKEAHFLYSLNIFFPFFCK